MNCASPRKFKRRIVFPRGQRPESLGERASENRIAEHALCRRQVLHHLRGVQKEKRNPPVALQRKVGQQGEILSLRFGRPKCSPRTRWHDSGILSHRFSRYDV